jgi:hypothetical protein
LKLILKIMLYYWSAYDLQLTKNYIKICFYIFKTFVQFFFIRTLDRLIYYRFDHFEVLIIYIILHNKLIKSILNILLFLIIILNL